MSITSRTAGSSEVEVVTEIHQRDVEKHAMTEGHLLNTTVQNISWRGVSVTVKDRETKLQKVIVDSVHGYVEAGEMLALMGPSGSGKTTLLNVLASRSQGAASVDAKVLVNGAVPSRTAFRQMSRFVEQEDALIGSLTVRETLYFASRLASTSSLPRAERAARIDGLLGSFGLGRQSDTIIGTPIRKGISGGQKRRVGIASQLITSPKILFLDEPTSGLDSAASFEVISFLRDVARRNNLIVVASIHQPSTSTFNLFDKLLLLSGGKTHYFGPLHNVDAYYESIGRPIALHVNPAEYLLDLVNIDFAAGKDSVQSGLEDLSRAWQASPLAAQLSDKVASCEARQQQQQQQQVGLDTGDVVAEKRPSFPSLVLTLLHRSFVKSYRDVIAYEVRMAMYLGLAIMMGTVWVRLKTEQEYIQPFINAIVSCCAVGPSLNSLGDHWRDTILTTPSFSSSVLLLCHSWPWPTSLPSSRTNNNTSKSSTTASMAQPSWSSPTSS
jgi:ABC-type multidrug transport system ATPase subunit